MTPWRQPVPAAFWDWARWRLSGHHHGPLPPRVARYYRAHRLRAAPPDWHVHLAWIAKKPRPKVPVRPAVSLGIFGSGNGAVFTHPGGDSEMAVELLANGFTYALLNVGEAEKEWATFRHQADARGLLYGPWARETSAAAVHEVEAIADAWLADRGAGGRIVGHNVENPEATSTLRPWDIPTGYTPTAKQRLGIPEGWIGNDLGWVEARFDAVAPECFMNVRRTMIPKVCCDHAAAESGAPAVAMFGTGLWSEALLHPELYEPMVTEQEYLGLWPGPFLVYSMNGQDPARWRRR